MVQRLNLDQLVRPEDFAPQDPPAAADAARYGEEATAASLATGASGILPFRVAYGPDRAHRLDVFAPAGGKTLPVFIFLHGGAWIAGHPWWCSFMAPAILSMPAIFVAPTYRLAPAHRFPAQLDDVAAAFDWVRANIGGFGGDPERIAIGGHSAGGHLAALLTLKNGIPVKACFPVSAPFNIHYPNCAPGSGEERVYKFLLQRREDDHSASPVNYIGDTRVPFHVTYGERDFERIIRTGGEFVSRLTERGVPVKRVIMKDASHFDTHLALRDPAAAWYDEVKAALLS